MKKNYILIFGILLLILVGGYFWVQELSSNVDKDVVEIDNVIPQELSIIKKNVNDEKNDIFDEAFLINLLEDSSIPSDDIIFFKNGLVERIQNDKSFHKQKKLKEFDKYKTSLITDSRLVNKSISSLKFIPIGLNYRFYNTIENKITSMTSIVILEKGSKKVVFEKIYNNGNITEVIHDSKNSRLATQVTGLVVNETPEFEQFYELLEYSLQNNKIQKRRKIERLIGISLYGNYAIYFRDEAYLKERIFVEDFQNNKMYSVVINLLENKLIMKNGEPYLTSIGSENDISIIDEKFLTDEI